MSSKTNKLVTGSIVRVIEFFVGAIVGILLMPFIIHTLGDKQYGLWIFIGSLLEYFSVFDFGLSTAVQRFVSGAVGKKDYKEINKIINTSLFIFIIIGIATLLISVVIAFILPMFIKNISEPDVFRKVIIILGLNFALGFPIRVFYGIQKANLRFDFASGIEIIKIFVRTFLIIIFLKFNYGIITLALITFSVELVSYFIHYIITRKIFKYIQFSRKLVDRAKVKSLFGYSIYTFICQLADQLRFNLDNLVIVIFIGLNAVTLYSIGARLVRYFLYFMTSGFGMTLPIFSQYEGMGDYKSIQEKYIFLTKLIGYVAIFVSANMVIFGKIFIIKCVGQVYAQSYTILLILLIPFIFDISQMAGTGVLFGISKHKYLTITNVIEGIANLILSIILVKRYGIFGVALGTAIPMIIVKLFIQPIYTCKVIDLSVKRFYLKIILPIVLISSAILVTFWIITNKFIFLNYFSMFSLAFLESVLFFIIILRIGFNYNEKQHFANILNKKNKLLNMILG